MATINQSGINFNNINKDAVYSATGKYSHYANTDNGNFDVDYLSENPDDIAKSFNAIENDWNGAVVGENKTLNTTGEVLSRYKVAI